MSCQQASRAQEDPYAFTESAPLQANSLLYANHSSAVSNSSTTNSNTSGGSNAPASAASSATTTIVSSGASLLLATSAANTNATKDTVVVTAPSPQHLRVGSSPTSLKVRYNGVVTTTTAAAAAATMGVQRTQPQSAVTATPVFSKPALQIKQQSPVQATVGQTQLPMVTVGKQIKKVLPLQKPPLMATVAAGGTKVVAPLQQQHQQPAVLSTAGGSILKFIKIPQLGKGVPASGGLPQGSFIQVTTSADGARKLLATSSAGLNSTISVTSTGAATAAAAAAAVNSANRNVSGGATSVPTLPTVSPTKIRLIQPQSQGKLYLQAPNSNSLAATTHISSPISIAALRNSLVKQQQLQQQQQQQQQQGAPLQQQVVQASQQALGGQPLKQQQIAQQSPSRTQLQTQQALQLQQTQTQSQLVLQQTKPKQTLINVSAQQQPLQSKQAPKQLGKQLTEVQQQVQKQQLAQSPLPALPPVAQQSTPRQEGVSFQPQGVNQLVRQVQLQTGVQKSPVQMHHQPQVVVQMQPKQSLLLQQQQQQQQPKPLPSPPQQAQLLVQQAQQRKHQQSPQSQVRGRQGPVPPKAGTSSPPIAASGELTTTTNVTNGSLLVKVTNATTTASTTAANVLAHSKTPASLDNQARRSAGQQSLLIGATAEHPSKPLSQQQSSGANSADSDRTLSVSPSSVMKSDAKRAIVTNCANIAGGEITEGSSKPSEGCDSPVANLAKPGTTPLNERSGKVKQPSGRKSGSAGKAGAAKQSKPSKRSYNHRSMEERQDAAGCVPPPAHPLPSVPSAASSSAPSESFQAAFAKMARPAAPEPHYPNEVVSQPATPKVSKVKKESARKLFVGGECDQEGTVDVKPVKLKFVAPKVPGAIAVPITRPKVKEWHAPGSYMFDLKDPGDGSDEDAFEGCPNTLSFWYEESIAITMPDTTAGWGMHPRQLRGPAGSYGNGLRGGRNKHTGSSMHDLKFKIRMLTRDERLELKKAYLQRRAVQYRNGLRMRNISAAKRKLEAMAPLIKRVDKRRLLALSKESEKPKCIHEGCDQAALVRTSHCYNHITANTDQRLFQRCTAKFADNSQCRLPVFDISHELVLCKEHAWKHDNHDKMSQEVKLQKKPVAAVIPFATNNPASNATVSVSRKKGKSSLPPAAVVVRPQKRPKKKKKLSPLQQQLQLQQQQHKQFVALNQQQHAHCVQANQANVRSQVNGSVHTPANVVYQQQQQAKVLPSSTYNNEMVQQQPSLQQQQQYAVNGGGIVGSVPVKQQVHLNGVASIGNRNVHIPLTNAVNNHSLDMIGSPVYQGEQDDTPMQLVDQQLQQHAHQQGQDEELHHQSLPDDQLMLSYMQEQQLQEQQQQQQQLQQQLQYGNGSHSVQPMLNTTATQDLLTICENSSAYASSEDTGVGGLSESELMATQEVIEEIIPFEIGNLLNTNVLSQLAPDALNELLFAGGEQDEHDAGTAFEGTTREVEDDIERALEHVKSLDDMHMVESANFLGDFLENVDDEMLDGADICSTEQMLQSTNNANDIRGLVHT